MSSEANPYGRSPEDDAEPALTPEEKLERAYQHVTEAMATGADEDEYPPMPDTVGIAPPSAAEYEQKLGEMKDQTLRVMAEMENVRRRAQKDVEDASKYAVSNFARDLVPVIENLYRAISAIPEKARSENPVLKTLGEGIDMTLREFHSLLERQGIQRIHPMHEPFDHNFHQAVTQIDSDSHPAGTVLQVLQAGYLHHDRLLQPAMVGVARAPADAPLGSGRIDTHV